MADDTGVCKLGTLMHAQIMAGDLHVVLLWDANFRAVYATGCHAPQSVVIVKVNSCRKA
jgi:hypothetical protein